MRKEGAPLPGHAFPEDPEPRVVSSPFYRERSFDSKRAADLSKVTRFVRKFAPEFSASKPSRGSRRPREPSLPRPGSGHPGRLPSVPARWQSWSPPRHASQGDFAGAAATLRTFRLQTPRAVPWEALLWAPNPRITGPSDQWKTMLETVQAPLPGAERGLVAGFPDAGSEGAAAARAGRALAGWRALSALGNLGRAHRGGLGRAGEVLMKSAAGTSCLSRSGLFLRGSGLSFLPSHFPTLGCSELCTSCMVTRGQTLPAF